MDETHGTENVWTSLAAINMIMHRRVVEYLNAAVGAVNLAAQNDAAAQLIWRQHAVRQIMRAHNTFTAWSALIRYRAGESSTIPGDQRVFRLGDFLDWLAVEMQQQRQPDPHDDLQVRGGRETLQEALILLHSCAYGLGPAVRVISSVNHKGATVGVRYRKHGEVPPTLEALLNRQTDNWRVENLTFELTCVRDFLAMNDCALAYAVEEKHCTLTFFVPAARRRTWTRRLKPRRFANEPGDSAETILSQEGLRRSLQDSGEVELHDKDATHDSDHDDTVRS